MTDQYRLKDAAAQEEVSWSPITFSPSFTVDEWVKLLNDPEVFTTASLEIMKRMKDHGGQASCTELSLAYGGSMNFYNSGSSSLAKRIVRKTGRPFNKNSSYWPILYVGRSATKEEKGSFIWRLRDELSAALDMVDLSHVKLYVNEDLSEEEYAYSKKNFLDEVFMSERLYENLVAVLRTKKNIILQGAPGVGKTFAAKRLAWSLMGEKDESRIKFVQFHQNYSYEDFIMGYKPVEDGFELKYGIFYRFCQESESQPDQEFFFIIDEINRGNMSKIFGELLMLIEKDYRGTEMTLAYDGLPFSVPKNLYIIGMMNTADRSLAMIDYALRRRFSFFEMEPRFDSAGFIHYQNRLKNRTFDKLINKVKDLNHEISQDKSLGRGFCIGHSYFCGLDDCIEERLRSIVEYDIIPMLSEYWFDDANTLQRWENILQGIFK